SRGGSAPYAPETTDQNVGIIGRVDGDDIGALIGDVAGYVEPTCTPIHGAERFAPAVGDIDYRRIVRVNRHGARLLRCVPEGGDVVARQRPGNTTVVRHPQSVCPGIPQIVGIRGVNRKIVRVVVLIRIGPV